MSSNKFHFEFKKRTSRIYDFFSLHIQKRNYNCYLSLNFILFICLKKKNIYIYIFLNYYKCKLLTFTQKNKRASEACVCVCVYRERERELWQSFVAFVICYELICLLR